MKNIAIIPARMGSSRFPGKPLATLLGKPMLQWVYEGTRACHALSGVYVATCDEDIRHAAADFGAPVIMTAPTHERASDRVAEAARGLDADVVVMVQGDEPMVIPSMIDEALAPFAEPIVTCTNLVAPIDDEAEFTDPNTIKVIMASNADALYFSRAPIPHMPHGCFVQRRAWKQVCIIGFRAPFLQRYAALAPTYTEQFESVDMLRILGHGLPVRLVPTTASTRAVDTIEDLATVAVLMAGASR